ncbi:MAG: amidohydrolase family protein, partial [Anaerolineae bacterium]|nr:amidohydrolase family protein [Anaerolineae bacterium]
WEGVLEIGSEFQALPIILTAVNIGSERRLLPMLKRLHNLYIETSYYTVHRGIENLVNNIGASRILFGSGMPYRDPGPALTALGYSLIGNEEKRMIAGGNLLRLLKGAA